ncbi:MAG TPA: ABC transporter permease [Gaiellaceae bacterium]|jgi:simple sugar transport system permease protein
MTEAALPPTEHGPPPVTPLAPETGRRFNSTGLIVSLITTTIAFLVGGIVVLVTGHDPIGTYRAIFRGTGFTWLIPGFGDRTAEATNLQQTLLDTTPLILCGLAVGFAFRCGMFNIGGQGQYFAGSYAAVITGSMWGSIPGPAHIVLCVVVSIVAGAAWGGIAGFLKATTGAHEVISTIMLNYIAIWIGEYFFGLQGPFVGPGGYNPISNDILGNVHLPVFWGDPVLQGLDIGFFFALMSLLVYWATLNRTTLGFEVRAVGFNPEAARYGGISVKRNYFLALAISGGFAGLAGATDVLGWQFHIATSDILVSNVGFLGIAVALLGRNSPVGILFAGLLFGALTVGTSSRQLDPAVFDPSLAGNLTLIIQGLVVLFVGADLLVLSIWNARKKIRLGGGPRP